MVNQDGDGCASHGDLQVGPHTVHVPTKTAGYIYDVAKQYMDAGVPTIILAGREYGSGSSRDWAAKGASRNFSISPKLNFLKTRHK